MDDQGIFVGRGKELKRFAQFLEEQRDGAALVVGHDLDVIVSLKNVYMVLIIGH